MANQRASSEGMSILAVPNASNPLERLRSSHIPEQISRIASHYLDTALATASLAGMRRHLRLATMDEGNLFSS